MRNLSNPPQSQPPTPDQLSTGIDHIGYTVRVIRGRHAGEIVHLTPIYDCIGFGAQVGEVVEVSSLGLCTHARVLRHLNGTRRRYDLYELDETSGTVTHTSTMYDPARVTTYRVAEAL